MISFQISKSALRMASSLVTYATKKKKKKKKNFCQLKKQMLVPCVLIIMVCFFLFSCTRIPNKLFHTQNLTQLHGCTSPAFFFGHKSSNEASKRKKDSPTAKIGLKPEERRMFLPKKVEKWILNLISGLQQETGHFEVPDLFKTKTVCGGWKVRISNCVK